MELSVIIPARNEQDTIRTTLRTLQAVLDPVIRDYEVLVVNDHSTDRTPSVVAGAMDGCHRLTLYSNPWAPGYGYAVLYGLYAARGGWVVVMTADGSDDPDDLVAMLQCARREKVPAVFGERWTGAKVKGYPRLKYVCNRFGNIWISRGQPAAGWGYTDWTNPFKLYRRAALLELGPFVARDQSLGLELALRWVRSRRGFAIVQTSWQERLAGRSKFRLVRDSWRYLRTALREGGL